MKGPKWLQKLNDEELTLFDPRQKEQHYLAGPGQGRILQEEHYEFADGNVLEFGTSNLPCFKGAKFWHDAV